MRMGECRYESTSTKTSRRLSHELLLSLVSSVLLVRPSLHGLFHYTSFP